MNTQILRNHLAEGGSALFNLTQQRAFLRLTGNDRVRYLNGQVSNNIRNMPPEEARGACVMTAKGKMNAFIWVIAQSEALVVDTEKALQEDLAMRLERYIISDDVTLDDLTGKLALYHLIGEGIVEKWPELPEGITRVRSRRYGLSGVDLLGAKEVLEAWLAEAIQHSKPFLLQVDEETAETFRIEQGIPRWGAELDENTIPVEAGLEREAIDYHKGCYIGQEVISRIKSIGHVNRNLVGFTSAEVLPVGTRFIREGRDVGGITSSAWSFALEKGVALGYLKRGVDVSQLEAEYRVEVRPLPLIA